MAVIKKPDLSDPVLRAKLAKGMGHNYYGEPAWPNDLLYMFPVVIFGTFACLVGLAVMDPAANGEPANPFATPLEILPEWYFFPTFQLLRTVPNKLLGVLLMAAVPAGLLTVPFLESINKFQNPFRRPIAMTVFLLGTVVAIWLGIGATLPIDISLTLGLFLFFVASLFLSSDKEEKDSFYCINYTTVSGLTTHGIPDKVPIPYSSGPLQKVTEPGLLEQFRFLGLRHL